MKVVFESTIDGFGFMELAIQTANAPDLPTAAESRTTDQKTSQDDPIPVMTHHDNNDDKPEVPFDDMWDDKFYEDCENELGMQATARIAFHNMLEKWHREEEAKMTLEQRQAKRQRERDLLLKLAKCLGYEPKTDVVKAGPEGENPWQAKAVEVMLTKDNGKWAGKFMETDAFKRMMGRLW